MIAALHTQKSVDGLGTNSFFNRATSSGSISGGSGCFWGETEGSFFLELAEFAAEGFFDADDDVFDATAGTV